MTTLPRCAAAVLACTLAISGCANPPASPDSVAPRADAVRPQQLRANQIIVTLIDDNTVRWMQTRQALAAEYRLSVVGEFPLRIRK